MHRNPSMKIKESAVGYVVQSVSEGLRKAIEAEQRLKDVSVTINVESIAGNPAYIYSTIQHL